MPRPPALAAVCCLVMASTAPSVESRQASGQFFVGRTWISTDPSAAPSTLRIFLPDGTLVMGSCSETFRLASWRRTGVQRIEWREDTARIEAEVAQPRPNQLRLRLRLRGETKDEHYQLAKVPFVCPDARPGAAPATVSVSGAGDRAPRIVTPASTTYRCGNETYKIAFHDRQAYVTLPGGSITTLKRLNAGAPPAEGRRFSNGRLTFVQTSETGGESRVSFARGRMAPVPCTQQN